MRTIFLTPAIAALALAACGSGNNDDGSGATTAPMNDVTADASAPISAEDAATVPTGAQEFVDKMAPGDQFEIESSKLATTMSKNASVKEFAAQMIRAHTSSTTDLKSVLASMSNAPTPNPALNPSQQADLAALRAAGEGFDKMYVDKQTTAHNQALALLQGYAASGDAQPLKDFAIKTSEIVESHREMLKKITP